MARKNFSKATIARRFAHAGGRCEGIIDGKRCNVVLVVGRWQCDHDNPDGLTGEPTFENARALCQFCHGLKTKRDVANIAQAKRREIKATGADKATVSRGPEIKSAGFKPVEKVSKIARGGKIEKTYGLRWNPITGERIQ